MKTEEQSIDLDLENIKKRRITIRIGTVASLFAAAAIGLTWGNQWIITMLDRSFYSEAQAQVLQDQVKEAADAAKQAAQSVENVSRDLTQYVKQQDLKSARERLNVLKQQLSETQLWESSNGANDISRARKIELAAQIEIVTAYIQCMEAQRPVCDQ